MGERFVLGGTTIQPGQLRSCRVELSETYTSEHVHLPVTAIRGTEPGPTVFVTGAVHGNELNGTAIVRELIETVSPDRLAGTLICVPVVNVFGFFAHSRYLPDGRDLNRVFPGSPTGSMASRVAHRVFEEIIRRCDYGIDIHTAGATRLNMPHVRGDMDDEAVRRLAKAFGTRVIMHRKGRKKTLRRQATERQIPTINFEAGEPGKVDPRVAREGAQGVRNVLIELGMIEGKKSQPSFQVIARDSSWIRADRGGIFALSVRPGQLVYEGNEIGVNTNPFGKEINCIRSPLTGMVIGVATSPMVHPGSPLCHIVKLEKTLSTVERALGLQRPESQKA